MRIGVTKEIKDNEYRVGLIPSTVGELVAHGHQVLVEKGAGLGAGLADSDYVSAGAKIVASADLVFERAELIVKVKEPLSEERRRLRRGQALFTYLHLAPDPEQTRELMASGVIAIAYETVTDPQGKLPLLTPMSEVAGRMAAQVGAQYLERPHGGRGILLGGVPGVDPAEVVIFGAGVVGSNAALIAAGMQANVTVTARSAELHEKNRSSTWRACAYRHFYSGSNRSALQEGRSGDCNRAGAGRDGSEADFSGDGKGHEAGLRHRRCFDRPGWQRRNLAPDHAFAANLHRRRRGALLRCQYAGRGPADLDFCPQQRHAAIRPDACG